MGLKDVKREYITYPIMTLAVVIGMSVLAGLLIILSLLVNQIGLRISGTEYGYFEGAPFVLAFIAPSLLILTSPLFPIFDIVLLFCEKSLTPSSVCSLPGQWQTLWSLSILIGTVAFYCLLGYMIAVCRETISLTLKKSQTFAFYLQDPWRIARIVWLLLAVAMAVVGLSSINYLPKDFFAILPL